MLQSYSIALLSTVVLALYVVGLVVYRLLLHPLAGYPGPFFAKITGWYQFNAVLSGNNHIFLQKLHEEYGKVVRVGPNSLSFNTITALNEIYSDRKANVIKTGFTDTHAELNGHRNLFTVTDPKAHAQKRRLISHAFSEEAIRSSEVYILDRVRSWCSQMQQSARPSVANNDGWSTSIDAKTWVNNLNLDVMGELCIGKSFGAVEAGWSRFPDLITNLSKQTQIVSWIPMEEYLRAPLKVYESISLKLGLRHMQGKVDFETAVAGMVQERLSPENPAMKISAERKQKDFFYYLMQALDPETGEKLQFHDMIVESGLLFGAGVDTSSSCLSATLFYLVHYPEQMKKIVAEITDTFDNVEEIKEGSKLQSCKYLRASIDESLRLSPPVPGPLLRKVCAGGMTVAGSFVPEGSVVSVPSYAIHHNEQYFPDSWTFKPERWLPDGAADDAQLKVGRAAFSPFSAGPRACIGRKLAYLDMMLVLSWLLFLFEIRLAPEDHLGEGDSSLPASTGRHRRLEYQLDDWFVTGRSGPMIQLRKRS